MSESIEVKMESLMNASNKCIREIDDRPMSEEYLQAMDKAKKKYEEKISQINAKAELDKANEKIAVREDQIDKLKKMLIDCETEMKKIIEEKDKQLKEKDDIITNLRNDVIPTKSKEIHNLKEQLSEKQKDIEYLSEIVNQSDDIRRDTSSFMDRITTTRVQDMPSDLLEPFRRITEMLHVKRPNKQEWENSRYHVDSIERIDNSTHVDVKEFSAHDVETLKDARPKNNQTETKKKQNKDDEKKKNKNGKKRSGNPVNNASSHEASNPVNKNNASSHEASNLVNKNNASSNEASKLINNTSSPEASNPSNKNNSSSHEASNPVNNNK